MSRWLLLTFLFALLGNRPAIAADAERFPLAAEIAVPEGAEAGVQRITVPLDLRSQDDPDMLTDLMLLDAEGAVIPTAVARGERELETERLPIWPLDNRLGAYEIKALERPIDGLLVRIGAEPGVAEVHVETKRNGHWKPWGEPQRVWRHELGDHTQVDLPSSAGPFRVLVRPVVGSWRPRRNDIEGFRQSDADVPRVDLRLPVSATVLEEDGWTRYVIELPHRLPLTHVDVHAVGDVFSRDVSVRPALREPYEHLATHGRIHRTAIGGASVDLTTVLVPGDFEGDTLLLYVHDDGDVPLEIPEVTVSVEGVELLVHDPGPGPLLLLGGAPEGTGSLHDLNVAVPELRRLAEHTLTAAPATANPAWRPPEERAALAGPGTVVDTRDYTWRVPVQGEAGLSRIGLSHEVLQRSDPTRSDLRLLTSDGHQVPALVVRRAIPERWGTLTTSRTEEDGISTIRIAIPHPELPIEDLEISTDAPIFDRRITVSRVDGPHLVTLRTLDWVGADRPLRASVHIGRIVGDELVLTIDNGPDAPLPIQAVRATGQSWEMLASLPDEPVWLYGGSRAGSPPDYDLLLLQDSIDGRANARSTLGPLETLEPSPPSPLDRALLLGGIALLCLGLGVLMLRLLRAVPPAGPNAEPATPGSDPATPEPQTRAPTSGPRPTPPGDRPAPGA